MITDVQIALEQVRARIRAALRAGEIANITKIAQSLDLSDETTDDFWDKYLSECETLISYERDLGSSPMTNTSATAVALMDLGGRSAFVICPGDSLIDLPMLAYSTVGRKNRSAAFHDASDWIVSSRQTVELPGSCPLPDAIRVVPDFPKHLLHETFARIFRMPPTAATEPLGDIAEAVEIIKAYGGKPPSMPLKNPDNADIEKLTSVYLDTVLA